LLRGHDPAERIKELMAERDPIYAEADVAVQSREVSHDLMVDEIVRAMRERIGVGSVAAPTEGKR
jgi:shikimate kinase